MNKNLILILWVVLFSFISINTAISYNYEYVNVTTRVNVTNAYPEILNITVDLDILLNAGTSKQVFCNVSVRDWNGYTDIQNVNGTLYHSSSSAASADNNNSHYTDTNCSLVNGNGFYGNYSCNFTVWYYANPGNWTCNITVIDDYNFTDTGEKNTTIQTFYALNVTPLIDFGDMAVGDTKNNITANVTNYGNANINISVEGYGATPNDGLAMNCQQRNITIDNLHYSINATVWGSATALTGASFNVTGLTVPKRTAGILWNQTYWHLYIPPAQNPYGLCNGTVVFTAWSAS